MLIAAAGFHNILLMGSPGSGKTMAGKILSGILPKLSPSELSDVYSIKELVDGESTAISDERPVRIIGPNITVGKLLGNAVSLTPGEMALANHGILFADELPLFKTEVLDFLRTPLEERKVHLMKKGNLYSFDSNFIFLGTGNPCKCGLYYEGNGKCRCSEGDVNRYLLKIKGPFLERIDIVSEVRSITSDDMASIYIDKESCESPEYRKTVEECWNIAHERYGADYLNGTFPEGDFRDAMRIPEEAVKRASELSNRGFFSARGFTRLVRVARTIADIKGSKDISTDDIEEASQFRMRGY